MTRTLSIKEASELATNYFKESKYSLSEKICRKLIKKVPNDPHVNHLLGASLIKQQKIDDAGPFLRRALKISGGKKNYINTYGIWLVRSARYDKAMTIFESILKRDPNFAPAYTNIGLVYQRRSDFPAAERAHKKALELKPDYRPAIHNLGNTLRAMKRLDEAEEHLNRALSMSPKDDEIRLDRGICRLLAGNYREGWEDYESRLTTYAERSRHNALRVPYWRGEEFAGKNLLIYNEQGFGDLIQCARFFPMAKALGGNVYFAGPEPITRLFEAAEGIDGIAKDHTKFNDFDLRIPVFSLPRIFSVEHNNIPDRSPYLSYEPGVETVTEKSAADALSVGLCWAGNPENKLDADRSLPGRYLKELVPIEGVDFYSLQFGDRNTDLRENGLADRVTLLTDEQLGDFYRMGGILKQMDLIVTVDTVVCHLAGALNIPTYLMLATNNDWRWGAEGSSTPWYPSVTIFRQRQPRQWKHVIDAVRQRLEAKINE